MMNFCHSPCRRPVVPALPRPIARAEHGAQSWQTRATGSRPRQPIGHCPSARLLRLWASGRGRRRRDDSGWPARAKARSPGLQRRSSMSSGPRLTLCAWCHVVDCGVDHGLRPGRSSSGSVSVRPGLSPTVLRPFFTSPRRWSLLWLADDACRMPEGGQVPPLRCSG